MKTTVVNIKRCRHTNYIRIDRLSQFGNPYRIGWYYKKIGDRIIQRPKRFSGFRLITRPIAIKLYKKYFYDRIETDIKFRWAVQDLKGHLIACWCEPEDCHGGIIVEYLED